MRTPQPARVEQRDQRQNELYMQSQLSKQTVKSADVRVEHNIRTEPEVFENNFENLANVQPIMLNQRPTDR
jgi:hypothetical protein